MTIYNINRGIGWASSGVEYAQAYRASILRKLGETSKFVFTDMFQGENLAHFTANIGFKDDEIIWLYGFFTDIRIAPTTYSLSDFERSLSTAFQKTSQTDATVHYTLSGKECSVVCFLRKDHPQVVQRVEYLSRGKLIRKDYFSYTKMFSEYYAPKDGVAHLYQRSFFNEDGSIAYEEQCRDGQSLYYFPDGILFSKEELLARFFTELELTSQDLLLVDRSTGIGQALLRHRGAAKVAVVIHAEHYSAPSLTEKTILWNNYYEYMFTHADQVDAFITSTQLQQQVLEEQFRLYSKHQPRIVTLPVGSIDVLRQPQEGRRPFSLLTCSRLASEKHIDWLVEAVVRVQAELPEVQFSIYGAGGEEAALRQRIEDRGAQDFIHLMGHQDLTDRYQQYEMYLTASTSEGFGLTLMEAVGSGLPIIGLDVPYGNPTFVTDGENGYLIPRTDPDDSRHYAQLFAKKIVAAYRSGQLPAWHAASYERAKDFLTDRLEEAWQAFIKEMCHDSVV